MAKKILIIDDSALMRRVISDIIKTNKQYEVADFARDGLEGFDRIVSHPKMYDAIILDINMPKMNGLELLEMLQKNRLSNSESLICLMLPLPEVLRLQLSEECLLHRALIQELHRFVLLLHRAMKRVRQLFHQGQHSRL